MQLVEIFKKFILNHKKINMKLLLALLFGFVLHGQVFSQNKEEDEIKKVCLTETEAYNNFDFDKLASFHVKGLTDQLTWNNADGSFGVLVGWNNIAKDLKDWFATSKKEKQEQTTDNFQFFISGDLAFVSYSTTSKNEQGKITKMRDNKTLRRIKGQWKILTIQAYVDFSGNK
jgi:ketosteroid isomerase-like protein